MGASEPLRKLRILRPGLNPVRGLAFALLFGAVGFFAPILIGLAFTLCHWVILGSHDFDRAYDLIRLPRNLAYSVFCTAVVFSATGWVWRAVEGPYRLTPTLLVVFAICVPSWFFLGNLVNSLDPRPVKDGTRYQSLIEPEHILPVVLPAIASAIVLTMIRARRESVGKWKGPPDPELA
jgi:hypothetical protein